MTKRTLVFETLHDNAAVCRLDPDEPIPTWANRGDFFSITRSKDELSIVCPGSNVPLDTLCETGWKVLKIRGVLDFALVGILASVSSSLAKAGISIFAISTFNTDYILVRDKDYIRTVNTLRHDGHEVID